MIIYTKEALELLRQYNSNKYSFSQKFKISKKYKKDFYIDTIKIFESNGFDSTLTFTEIFKIMMCDGIYEPAPIENLDIFLIYSEYNANPKKFANVLRSKTDTPKIKHIETVIRNFLPSYNRFVDLNTSKILYDIMHKEARNAKCVKCETETVLWSGTYNCYSSYCSAVCSRKHIKNTPEEFKIASDRRQKTLNARTDEEKLIHSRKLSDAGIKRYKDPEQRKRDSIRVKKRIEDGSFTPCVTNSWTRWKSEVKGRKFRSSFDALFYIYDQCTSKSYEYEKLRIPYIFQEDRKIYITDFVSHSDKIVIEIKPHALISDAKNMAKLHYLEEWCVKNSYNLKIISESDLSVMMKDLYKLKDLDKEYRDFIERMNGVYKWI